MTLGIRKKLILSFVGMSLLVTLVAFFSVWLNFRAGFLQYVNDSRHASLVQMAEAIHDNVTSESDWQALTRNPRQWRALLESTRSRKESRGESSPDHSLSDNTSLNDPKKFNADRANRHRSHRKPPPRQRFILLDSNKTRIFGRAENNNNLLLEEIRLNDQLVGYVGLRKLVNLNNKVDQLFARKQSHYFIMIAIFSTLLAGVIAYFLSSLLTSPIKRLMEAMSAVERGDYSTKVDYAANDEIGRLVQSFNQLAQSLGQHERAQNQWISDISHELRTPLTALRGELEAVQDGVRALDTQRVDSIYEEILRLQRIVDDLHQLSLSDLGAMRYRFQPLLVSTLLNAVVDGQRIELEKTLIFELTVLGSEKAVYGDADRLRQVFHNLLQNSIRYTDAGQALTVTLDFQSQNKLTITWQDGSPGVDSESIEKLFDRLYRQESSRNREQGGSGLGLSICKNIIEAHSGMIAAEHSSLGGLKITLTLPFSK